MSIPCVRCCGKGTIAGSPCSLCTQKAKRGTGRGGGGADPQEFSNLTSKRMTAGIKQDKRFGDADGLKRGYTS